MPASAQPKISDAMQALTIIATIAITPSPFDRQTHTAFPQAQNESDNLVHVIFLLLCASLEILERFS